MALRALAFFCAAALYGQTQPGTASAPAPQPSAGLETDWEIAPVLQEMAAHAGRLLAELDRVDVRSWVKQGASATYLEQLESSRQQAKALEDGARSLAGNPQRLASGLVVLFRMQGLDAMVGSLVEGLHHYHGADEAQRLASLFAENGANRDRFQRYLVELAADQQERLQVVDKEAQRCRGLLAAPAPRAGKNK